MEGAIAIMQYGCHIVLKHICVCFISIRKKVFFNVYCLLRPPRFSSGTAPLTWTLACTTAPQLSFWLLVWRWREWWRSSSPATLTSTLSTSWVSPREGNLAMSRPECRRRTVFKSLVLPPLSGKSALHWAAAVNNVDATIALLKNGANKDMQDLKVRKREKAGDLLVFSFVHTNEDDVA